ncbi:hypothetical protein AAFC00_002542 [Neodothiora populina]|uniref:Uncharacterized protein n=1 Tax=Neodothiora populina TaxID=2781224 RepID=A0ABR3P7Q5_9PEZI
MTSIPRPSSAHRHGEMNSHVSGLPPYSESPLLEETHDLNDGTENSPQQSNLEASMHGRHGLKSPVMVREEENRPYIEGWPMRPQQLRESIMWKSPFTAIDCIISIAPVYFIVLAVLAAKLHGQSKLDNKLGERVVQMCDLGPTMFPIMFTAVADRSLKAIARFCAERGMKISILELLMASQTVWGTVESQVLLRRFTVVGAHLVILWTLSPLGGQASLRLLHTAQISTNSTSPIKYMPTIAMNIDQTNAGMLTTGDPGSALSVVNSLYSASLLAPPSVKSSTQDTWGNVRIPRLNTVRNITKSANGWIPVLDVTSPNDFTTLAGLPISGLSTKASTLKTSAVEYSYMNLACAPNAYIASPHGEWTRYLGQIWAPTNGSAVFHNRETKQQTSFFLDTNTPFDRDGERIISAYADQNTTSRKNPLLQERRNILFGNEYYAPNYKAGYQVFYRNCSIWSEFVEVKVQCDSKACGAICNSTFCTICQQEPESNATRPFND